MNREIIAIDVDDVLAAHVEAFIEFSNTNYGTSLTVEEYSDHWADLWQVEHDEIERRATEFHVPESVVAYAVKEEATNALRRLRTHYDLYVVTARRKAVVDVTFEWLDRHFPETFQGVHFVPIWEPNNTITKADICKQIGAQYLIDDLPRHCNVAAEGGIQAILFGDYVWNRSTETNPAVVRCKDWAAVLQRFSLHHE